MENKNVQNVRSTICLFTTALIWGLAFVTQRQGAAYLESFTYNGVRFLLGTVSLLPVIYLFEKGKTDKQTLCYTLKAGIIGGIILFTAANLQQIGIVITQSAGKSAFITGLYIVLVPIAGIFSGKKTTPLTWCGTLSACIGLYLLSMPEGIVSIGLGDIVLLIGAVFWTAHIIVIDKYSAKTRPIRFSMIQFFVCAILSLITAFLFEEVRLIDIYDCRIPIIYGGVFSVGIAYTLQVVGQRHVPPARAAIIFSLEALFAAVGGALILGERMSFRGYIGCGFIFAGIILSQIVLPAKTSPVHN